MLPKFESTANKEYPLNDQEHRKNKRDDRDAGRDTDEQDQTSGDADQRKERLEDAVRHLFAEERQEEGDNTAD